MSKKPCLTEIADELSSVSAKVHIMYATLQYLAHDNSEEVKKISFGSSLLLDDIVSCLKSLEKDLRNIK